MNALLIIEDDPDTNAAFCDVLAAEGFRCVGAIEGEEGLRVLESEQPQLVVLDHYLPDMDGAEFLRRKAAIPSVAQVPVVLVSADPAVSEPDGIVAHLQKPFDISDLLREVRRHLPSPVQPEAA